MPICMLQQKHAQTPVNNVRCNMSKLSVKTILAVQVTLYKSFTGKGEEGEEARRVGRLSFVDLAGSERANRTGNVGARLK